MNRDSICGWNRRFEVSGAKYSGVPQKCMVSLSEKTFPFAITNLLALYIHPYWLIQPLALNLWIFFLPLRISYGKSSWQQLIFVSTKQKKSALYWGRMESRTSWRYWSISGGNGWSSTWTIESLPGSKPSRGILFNLLIIYYCKSLCRNP